ncbi:cysteine--tRNA ligase [Rubrivirga sp. SAORIC476]|uniref:cysteine--tRNA ligase n=1 Tax=Rubrivirga sp. SAORIC476 TaxID=1961794 RepID=UPI000BA9C660|nr:cysteine--tRNA ligase [Rubrivirga sp. SAORIC476]PAP79604.1 cysteine--tRNA ligase [Rubrivirga sp. SAORIC476]
MPESPPFRLTNTLAREVQTVTPVAYTPDGRPLLRFYSCGPTVYSYAHIGNFRTFLTADLVVRTAEALGWAVRYVSNVTDVGHLTEDDVADGAGEDKMAKALASKDGEAFETVWDLARHYTEALKRDWDLLNLIEPDIRPRATEHVREQILAVEALMASGHAYETADGVYFHVPSFPDYGKLSGNTDAEGLVEGTREVVRDDGKRDPRDFALWKKDAGHLMQWYSPFVEGEAGGWGFPGWHLECSVMAQKYLGETIDLHGGGEDLRFPHHECEIAQAEALTGQPFSRYWMHTRFLQVEGEKMSKSKGNFLTVRDLTAAPEDGGREDWAAPLDPLALRLALISGHYAKPFNLTRKTLADAAKNLQRYRDAVEAARLGTEADRPGDDGLSADLDAAYADALAAMADDLNTPIALAAGLRGAAAILKAHREAPLSGASARAADAYLDRIDALLGIVHAQVPADAAEAADDLAAQVEPLVVQRTAARAAKDWARADAIRDELAALGVEVVDTPAGPEWRRTH